MPKRLAEYCRCSSGTESSSYSIVPKRARKNELTTNNRRRLADQVKWKRLQQYDCTARKCSRLQRFQQPMSPAMRKGKRTKCTHKGNDNERERRNSPVYCKVEVKEEDESEVQVIKRKVNPRKRGRKPLKLANFSNLKPKKADLEEIKRKFFEEDSFRVRWIEAKNE